MQTSNIQVPLRDGMMGAYLAVPDGPPAGAVIAIMEIWGVNHTMRQHAHEFAQAGFVCLVPDLFWRQEPGVELSDGKPGDVQKAFDLYYDFDYDLGVCDMEDTMAYLKTRPECNGKVGAVGYCLGGKLCYLMCCRTEIDCAVAYYGTYIEHRIREATNLHRPFLLHMAMKDRGCRPKSTKCWSGAWRPIRWCASRNIPRRTMPLRATAAGPTARRRLTARWN